MPAQSEKSEGLVIGIAVLFPLFVLLSVYRLLLLFVQAVVVEGKDAERDRTHSVQLLY